MSSKYIHDILLTFVKRKKKQIIKHIPFYKYVIMHMSVRTYKIQLTLNFKRIIMVIYGWYGYKKNPLESLYSKFPAINVSFF